MRIKIKVTEKCISSGMKKSTKSCPIALAVVDSLGNDSYVSVHHENVFIRGCKKDRYASDMPDLPRSARRFIHHFDNGNKVSPFNFFLSVDTSGMGDSNES